MIVDTGLLVALERSDGEAWALLAAAERQEHRLRAPAGVLAQAWRGGRRQARLALALRAIDVDAMNRAVALEVGALLGRMGASDVVDGHVALLARQRPGQPGITSDRDDLEHVGVDPSRIIGTLSVCPSR